AVAGLACQLEPSRVKANVFICGSLNNPFAQMLFTDRLDFVARCGSWVHEWFPELFEEGYRIATKVNPVSLFLTSQLGFNPQRARADDVISYMEGVAQTDPLVFRSLLDDYRRQDGKRIAQAIRVPTLVIAGEDDCITPLPAQEEIVRAIPL